MKIVFVFLIVWAAGKEPGRDAPQVSFGSTPDSIEVCTVKVAEAVAQLQSKGVNAQAFCKEVDAGTLS